MKYKSFNKPSKNNAKKKKPKKNKKKKKKTLVVKNLPKSFRFFVILETKFILNKILPIKN
jgi:hypothetical protein